MKKQRFYQITQTDNEATINIYGYITQWAYFSDEVSSIDIKKEIDALDVDKINVFINSYGGEVAEAIAIYSALKRHKAEVVTYTDGFACSAATIIFCAGDQRIMGQLALLMIHNCMSYVGYANSEELRKAAEDNDKINQSSIKAYLNVSNLSEDEIKALMDNETWLTAEECIENGFATEIADQDEDEDGEPQQAIQSVQQAIYNKLVEKPQENEEISKVLTAIEKLGDGLAELKSSNQKLQEQIGGVAPVHQKEADRATRAANFFKALGGK
ncbi:MAG: Clp protease ClpP [Eubacterium sp.]|nr:Clp protease ClpP [Eubacterium sp.]